MIPRGKKVAAAWFLVFAALLAVAVSGRAESARPLPFRMGESMTYRVYWGVIPVGSSVITSRWVVADGRTNIAIQARTRTNKVLEQIYPVDDVIESVIDPDTFLPLRFRKLISEGRYRADETTVFDYQAGKAVWSSPLKNRTNEFVIKPDTRDLISFMYSMRTNRFEAGKRTHYQVMADEKIYDLYVNADKFETLKMDAFGAVRSLKMEPEAAFGGLFVRKGRMWLWVSDDERRLVTKIVAQVPVANIMLELDDVNGPGDDFWIKKNRNHREKK